MSAEHSDAFHRHHRRRTWLLTTALVIAIAGAASAPWIAIEGMTVFLVLAWLAMIAVLLLMFGSPPRETVERVIVPAAAPVRNSLTAAAQRELESLRAVQHELLAAKHAAEAATMAKGEFLATMSHEIRTPLNGIVPLLDLMRSTPLRPDQREYLMTAHQSALELLRIVDDILDYSKLEANKLEIEEVGINLKELVDSVAMLMERSATAKGLRLSVQIDPAVRLAVRGDSVRLRQVLTNLVSNAIKFTEYGSVTIQLSKRGESRDHHDIMFVVQDTGIGLESAAAEKLFKPFSQADASTTRLYGGTGLGLAICKRLIDVMHGKIGVRSELGRGSQFWFSVPLLKAIGDVRQRRNLEGSRAMLVSTDDAFTRRCGLMLESFGMQMLATAQAADALSKLRSTANMSERWRYEVLLIDLGSMLAPSAALIRNVLRSPVLDSLHVLCFGNDDALKSAPESPRVSKLALDIGEQALRGLLYARLGVSEEKSEREAPLLVGSTEQALEATGSALSTLEGRVLLVEDNPVNTRVAQRLLGLLGLEVTSVGNGQEALDQIAAAAFDVVLMDCQMPVLDGYGAARARRQREQDDALPHLPIIAMTANAMAGDREKCIAAGMDDYLSKPLDRLLLANTLARWLPSREGSASSRPSAAVQTPSPALITFAREVDAFSEQPALDTSVIEELLEVMGNEFSGLVRMFLEDAPNHISRLQTAVATGDMAKVIESAHVLKSSSANLGALQLAELAKLIEHNARNGDASALHALSKRIADQFDRTERALAALTEN